MHTTNTFLLRRSNGNTIRWLILWEYKHHTRKRTLWPMKRRPITMMRRVLPQRHRMSRRRLRSKSNTRYKYTQCLCEYSQHDQQDHQLPILYSSSQWLDRVAVTWLQLRSRTIYRTTNNESMTIWANIYNALKLSRNTRNTKPTVWKRPKHMYATNKSRSYRMCSLPRVT